MNNSIIILGKASGKIIKKLPIPSHIPDDLSLMNFLKDNKIAIATSCNGVNICKKCLVNITLVSCQISLNLFIEQYPLLQVEISYL